MSNPTTPEDSQPMISYRLVGHSKPLGPIIREIQALFMTEKKRPWQPSSFSKRGQQYFRQDFVMNIFCEL